MCIPIQFDARAMASSSQTVCLFIKPHDQRVNLLIPGFFFFAVFQQFSSRRLAPHFKPGAASWIFTENNIIFNDLREPRWIHGSILCIFSIDMMYYVNNVYIYIYIHDVLCRCLIYLYICIYTYVYITASGRAGLFYLAITPDIHDMIYWMLLQ